MLLRICQEKQVISIHEIIGLEARKKRVAEYFDGISYSATSSYTVETIINHHIKEELTNENSYSHSNRRSSLVRNCIAVSRW